MKILYYTSETMIPLFLHSLPQQWINTETKLIFDNKQGKWIFFKYDYLLYGFYTLKNEKYIIKGA